MQQVSALPTVSSVSQDKNTLKNFQKILEDSADDFKGIGQKSNEPRTKFIGNVLLSISKGRPFWKIKDLSNPERALASEIKIEKGAKNPSSAETLARLEKLRKDLSGYAKFCNLPGNDFLTIRYNMVWEVLAHFASGNICFEYEGVLKKYNKEIERKRDLLSGKNQPAEEVQELQPNNASTDETTENVESLELVAAEE